MKTSGQAGKPVLIKVGREIGHNGKVVIESTASQEPGIKLWSDNSYITIDGGVNGKCCLQIQKTPNSGISLAHNTHHIILTYLEVNNNGNEDNEHGIYIDVDGYSSLIAEISHCLIHDNYQDQLNFLGPNTAAPGYGLLSVHDNEISNLSDDGIESLTGGVDFYNNVIHGRHVQGAGHPDCLQVYRGYWRIYNNVFYDLKGANSIIFMELYLDSNDGHIRIYNNLIYEPVVISDNYYRGIDCAAYNKIRSLTDYVIANNTIVNLPAWGITFDCDTPATVTNVHIENNVIHNCFTGGGGQAIIIGSMGNAFTVGSDGTGADVSIDYNILSAGANGSDLVGFQGNILTYSQWKTQSGCEKHGYSDDPGLNGMFKPASATSAVIDKGTALGMYFTNDLAGVSRPQGAAWDIGAYELKELTAVAEKNDKKSLPLFLLQSGLNILLQFNSNTTTPAEIRVYSLAGRRIWQRAVTLRKGRQIISLKNISCTGSFMATVTSKNLSESIRIVLTKDNCL